MEKLDNLHKWISLAFIVGIILLNIDQFDISLLLYKYINLLICNILCQFKN